MTNLLNFNISIHFLTRKKSYNQRAIKNVIYLTLVFIILSSSFTSSVKSAPYKYEFQNEGWSLIYKFSELNTEPDSRLTLDIEIRSKQKNYDFKLWIMLHEPLYVEEKKGKDSDIHYAELEENEIRLETFTIIIPSIVEVGEVFVINLKVQSHNNPAGALGRFPYLDPVEYLFETSNHPQYVHNINVMLLPILKIRKEFNFPFQDSEFYFKIYLSNVGKGIAENVDVELYLPNELILIEGEQIKLIAEIPPGTQNILKWKVKTTEPGLYEFKLAISYNIIGSIMKTYEIEIYDTHLSYLLIIIFMVIILFILFLWRMNVY